MSTNIIVPNLGESISEATISKWYKKEGNLITKDEILLELETEKVALEVTAPESGILQKILKPEGESVNVGNILGHIAENANSTIKQTQDLTPKEPTRKYDSAKEETGLNLEDVGPAAKRILSEKEIDLSHVKATGLKNRITKADLLDSLSTDESKKENNSQNIKTTSQDSSQERKIEYVKFSRIRKTIAKRLKDSQNTAAILSTFNEIDMGNVISLRNKYKEEFQKKHSVKLGFMSFFIKASVAALKEIASINTEIQDEFILYKKYYNIAVAIGTEQGLVVPVIKNADTMSFHEVEKNLLELADKARNGKLVMQDFHDGTFSITNGGVYGSLFSTPIINPPQTAILGLHSIQKRPVEFAGEILLRPMMYVALSYDHRVVDGKDAVAFLSNIKKLIENPEKLLLEL